MTKWPDIDWEVSYSIQEIILLNNQQFPFWIRPYRTRHYILKVLYPLRGGFAVLGFNAQTRQQLRYGSIRNDIGKGWLRIEED